MIYEGVMCGGFVCCGMIVVGDEGGWGVELGEMMQKGRKVKTMAGRIFGTAGGCAVDLCVVG